MSERASVWFTPQFLLTFVVAAAYCWLAVGSILGGDEVVQSVGILIGMPLFVVMMGLVIRRQIRTE